MDIFTATIRYSAKCGLQRTVYHDLPSPNINITCLSLFIIPRHLITVYNINVYNMTSYHYIPEKRKFSRILCFREQCSRRRRVRRVTISFSVSAITFEGFKLRSSNLTHALLNHDTCRPIQNGRRRPFYQTFQK